MSGFRAILSNAWRLARNNEGVALAEMAISATLLLSTFLGVFEVAMACYTYNNVGEVARESARWAMVRGNMCSTYTPNQDHCGATSSDIQSHAETMGLINWTSCTTTSPCVTATWMTGTSTTSGTTQQRVTTWAACGTTSACKAPGNLVVVNVSLPYTLTVPFVRNFSMNLKSQAEMVVSQ